MNDREAIEDRFPRLVTDGYLHTSGRADDYNCVAWVIRDVQHWWSPEDVDGYCWLRELGDGKDIASYERFFAQHGFERCDDGSLVEGTEKIAVYGSDEIFDHVAFQRSNGKWSSKLGQLGDVSHDLLSSLEKPGVFEYPPVQFFMARPREPHPLADRGLLLLENAETPPAGALILPPGIDRPVLAEKPVAEDGEDGPAG